jgi:Protein of unknown function (DUF2568)
MTDDRSDPPSGWSAGPVETVLLGGRFVVELVGFASLAVWGFTSVSHPWNLLAGVAAPAAAIALWGLVVAPKAALSLGPVVRIVVEVAIFAVVTVAWWRMGHPWVAVAFAAAAVVTAVPNARANFRR